MVGDRGARRGTSMGDRWVEEAVVEKGPVVEVVVLTGDSVSEPLSLDLGRLSLRSRLRTRELLERL